MASEIQHKFADDYLVQGIVKSGADMEVILDSNVKEARNLAKDDFLIIFGCMKEVCKNESQKCTKQIMMLKV
jgi:hypothetical protein